MPYDPHRHHRRSIRLRNYDYSQPGAYFVTIDTHGHEFLFGEVVDQVMQPSDAGRAVEAIWAELAAHFPNVAPDAFVLMPNHVHAVVVITDQADGDAAVGAGSAHADNDAVRAGSPCLFVGKPTLGQIVAYYKHETTVRINALRDTPYAAVWQRNYYEHIVRDARELERIRRYIHENPQRWDLDPENPAYRRSKGR